MYNECHSTPVSSKAFDIIDHRTFTETTIVSSVHRGFRRPHVATYIYVPVFVQLDRKIRSRTGIVNDRNLILLGVPQGLILYPSNLIEGAPYSINNQLSSDA